MSTDRGGTVEKHRDRYGYAYYRAYCPGCGRLVERRNESGAERIAEQGCGDCDYDSEGGDE